jgi:hypothetical protein
VSYDWGTQWPGVFERHAEDCPAAEGLPCTCGPLGFIASITDPDSDRRIFSPMLESDTEARGWRREQELALDAWTTPSGNGSATEPRARVGSRTAPVDPRRAYEPPLRSGRPREHERRAPRVNASVPLRETNRHDVPLSALVDQFLDAAEDGEARDRDGRPYSDEALGELEWALGGYVAGRFSELEAGAVRGRHVFRLIEELEDAGMPRSRLESVIGALRRMFDYASDLGLVRVNPAAYVSLPSDDDRPRRRLRETIETRTPPASRDAGGFGESVISERTIWMLVKIVTLIFICIALVLAAESI